MLHLYIYLYDQPAGDGLLSIRLGEMVPNHIWQHRHAADTINVHPGDFS
jgi:hypothetical protein